jgi:hypothetical protein
MPNTAKPGRWPPSKLETDDTPVMAPNVVPIRADAGDDALDGFSSERPKSGVEVHRSAAPHGPSPAVKTKWLIAFGACFAIGAMAAAAYYMRVRGATPPVAQASPLTGRAVLNTRPDGAAVIVDGVSRGVTPVELELPAGRRCGLPECGWRTPDQTESRRGYASPKTSICRWSGCRRRH